jgi:hypothetical protein
MLLQVTLGAVTAASVACGGRTEHQPNAVGLPVSDADAAIPELGKSAVDAGGGDATAVLGTAVMGTMGVLTDSGSVPEGGGPVGDSVDAGITSDDAGEGAGG